MTFITNKPYHIYEVRRRTDWRILIPVVVSDGVSPFDFTGWQAHAQIRKKVAGTLIADFDTYDATIELDGGNMYLIRDKDDTDIKANQYVWDCFFLDTEGQTRGLIIESIFEIIGGPTE